MSEAALWDRLRTALIPYGHFTRLEYNPTAGIPDVDYCIVGVEGKIELKFTDSAPVRSTTAVFHDGGLRDEQEGWISTRVYHGGRVWILAQVDRDLFLVPGSYAEEFNSLTMHQLAKASSWHRSRQWGQEGWRSLAETLITPAKIDVEIVKLKAARLQRLERLKKRGPGRG